ncbi:myotubularin-related protein 11 isoform X2 [Accipiter gentilis]|uniref:myotubularin-related protein 11 isoform X2 n=1 Tax=Astur gentilis TaxID=8957 RepID=UPI00210FF64B|nr:myotubularin-related protein 11 isoform X2 [Accipiter gentilis]
MSGAPGGRRPAFPGLPGELVLEEAAGARQRCREGDGSVPGTLLCTNRRVAFLPAQAPGSRAFLHSEYDVALPCIRKLVAGKSDNPEPPCDELGRSQPALTATPSTPAAASSFTKPKVLTAASTLKFIPEELAVFCRDFRLLRFHFQENGLALQAFRVANAIAQAREAAAWLGDAGEGHDGWCCPAEAPLEDEDEDEEEGSAATLLFESLRDWEKELKRLGAVGWRVSAVNERFDMAPSLPQYLWVPSGLLDHDLKRTFAHFEEHRVPRLCWHHPGGGDLLRAAGFHAASEPGSEDVRCLEALLLGGRGPCVLADTAELPTLTDIQVAHLKLRALCLPGAAAEEKWLSALEGTRWLDHVRTCLRKAVEVASLLAGRRCSVLLQEPSDRDLNCLLASLVQLLGDPHTRTLPGFQSLVQREWVAAGHPFPHRLGLLRHDSPREEVRTYPVPPLPRPCPRWVTGTRVVPPQAPVFLLFLDCTWQLVRQFPAAFGFTEAYLLALHDSSFAPYFSTFLFSCQRQRGRGSPHQPRSQTYTPVNGWRDPQPGVLQAGRTGSPACRLPTVWDWGLRYSRHQRAQFRNPVGAAGTVGPPDAADPQTPSRPTDAWPGLGAGNIFVLTKGTLSPQPFPWRSGRPPPRLSRWAPSLESPGEWGGSPGGSRPPAAPPGLLLPCAAGPSVRLWQRCYLRGLPEAQRGRFAPSPAGLAEELTLLQDRLSAWQPAGPCTEAAGSPLAPSR